MAGWPGVVALATVTAGIALAIRLAESARTSTSVMQNS
jgi:hypothetical protein